MNDKTSNSKVIELSSLLAIEERFKCLTDDLVSKNLRIFGLKRLGELPTSLAKASYLKEKIKSMESLRQQGISLEHSMRVTNLFLQVARELQYELSKEI